MSAQQYASRVMHARRESQCPICKGWIRPGTLIAKCGGLWMHVMPCAIAHQHTTNHPGNQAGEAREEGSA